MPPLSIPITLTQTQGSTHGLQRIKVISDESIWARGQSWAILGIPLNERYLHSVPFPLNYKAIVDVFLEHLPQDLVPYWDF